MKKISIVLAFMMFFLSCTTSKNNSIKPKVFDMQAHRGGKGLMPENTIPAMLNAIDLKVVTLEMDLQVTKDKNVVVSHDPNFNANITTTPEGKFLSKDDAKKLLLYNMNYEEIKKYDVGLKYFADVPRQKKMSAYKPLLSDLLDATENYAKDKGINISYNIEVKSNKKNDGINHPPVEEFVELAMAVINQKGTGAKTVIQSFDPRALVIMHRKHPAVATSYLIEAKDTRSVEDQLSDLGFTPSVYSPHQNLVTKKLVEECHKKKMRIIPWTVNDLQRIKELKAMGVDGVISDYPDLFALL